MFWKDVTQRSLMLCDEVIYEHVLSFNIAELNSSRLLHVSEKLIRL